MNTARPKPGHDRSKLSVLLAASQSQSVLAERGADGSLLRVAYAPYGTRRAEPGTQSSLAFNGEFREPLGGYALGAGHRLYNPAVRRFHSPDVLSPFGDGGLNAYAYCEGDPLNRIDPSGRIPIAALKAFSNLIGARMARRWGGGAPMGKGSAMAQVLGELNRGISPARSAPLQAQASITGSRVTKLGQWEVSSIFANRVRNRHSPTPTTTSQLAVEGQPVRELYSFTRTSTPALGARGGSSRLWIKASAPLQDTQTAYWLRVPPKLQGYTRTEGVVTETGLLIKQIRTSPRPIPPVDEPSTRWD